MNISTSFTNNSLLPVSLETWQCSGTYVSKLNAIYVESGETSSMPSETGEWYVTNYIYDSKMRNKWNTAGYNTGFEIGKFRNTPCVKGDFVWTYSKDFQLEYMNGNVVLNKKI